MGRPTKAGSALRKAECQHIEFILSISRNSTHGAFQLGVTLRSLYIRLQRGEITTMTPKKGEVEIHPLSTPELSLREFRALLVQDTVRKSRSIAEAASTLGTSSKTIVVYMDKTSPNTRLERCDNVSIPAKIGRPRTRRDEDLPVSFRNQKPDIPIRNNQKTLDNLEVSVWVDPEERDHYYNLDFPWGTYGSRKTFREEGDLCHALGYGEDL